MAPSAAAAAGISACPSSARCRSQHAHGPPLGPACRASPPPSYAWAPPWRRRGQWRWRRVVVGAGPRTPTHGLGASGRRPCSGGIGRWRGRPRLRRRPAWRRQGHQRRGGQRQQRRRRRGTQACGGPSRRLDVRRVRFLPLLRPLPRLFQMRCPQAQCGRWRRQAFVDVEGPVRPSRPNGGGRFAPNVGQARTRCDDSQRQCTVPHRQGPWRQLGGESGGQPPPRRATSRHRWVPSSPRRRGGRQAARFRARASRGRTCGHPQLVGSYGRGGRRG